MQQVGNDYFRLGTHCLSPTGFVNQIFFQKTVAYFNKTRGTK